MTDKHISNNNSDDVVTPKLIEKHEIAMGEYLRGETVDHEDIDWDDNELSENDLHHIRLGEQELANGETTSHKDIAWKSDDNFDFLDKHEQKTVEDI